MGKFNTPTFHPKGVLWKIKDEYNERAEFTATVPTKHVLSLGLMVSSLPLSACQLLVCLSQHASFIPQLIPYCSYLDLVRVICLCQVPLLFLSRVHPQSLKQYLVSLLSFFVFQVLPFISGAGPGVWVTYYQCWKSASYLLKERGESPHPPYPACQSVRYAGTIN